MSYLGFIIKLAPDPGPGPRGWLRDCSESLEDLLGNGSKSGPPARARALGWIGANRPFIGKIGHL